MEEDYVALVGLVEEYKLHNDVINASLRKINKEMLALSEKYELLQTDHALQSNMMRELEDTVMHMDQELLLANQQLSLKSEESLKLHNDLESSSKTKKDIMLSSTIQLNAAKDEITRLTVANERLRKKTDHLESTVNDQYIALYDMQKYVAELEAIAGVDPRFPEKKLKSPSRSSVSAYVQQASEQNTKILNAPLTVLPINGATLAQLDIISDVEDTRSVEAVRKAPAPAEPHPLAADAARAALSRADAVRAISNRGDGSFGFKIKSASPASNAGEGVPTPHRDSAKAPGSAQKWAYTREDLLAEAEALPAPPGRPQERDLATILMFAQSPNARVARTSAPESPNPSRACSTVNDIHFAWYGDGADGDEGGGTAGRGDIDGAAATSEVRHKEGSSRLKNEPVSPKRRFRQPKGASTTLRA